MCECPGNQCHCEVLTAYVRECERSGILISKWREVTGCKNLSSFSYKHNSTASANLISSSSLMDDMPCTGSKCQRVSSSSNKSDIKIHRLTKVGGAFLDVIKKALTKKDFKRLERAKQQRLLRKHHRKGRKKSSLKKSKKRKRKRRRKKKKKQKKKRKGSRKSLEGSLEKSQRMLWKSQKDTEKRRWRKNRKKNLRRPPPFESLLMEDEGINSKLIDTKNIPPALL
uniref:BMPbinding endothelial regulator proteinlike [Bombus impatiens] n=1 Tax=Lepeophtheirus salmonis TaxID=72036 RepID=A0A0K2U5R1_LEPSM